MSAHGGRSKRPRRRAVRGPWLRGLLLAVGVMLVLVGSAGSVAAPASGVAALGTPAPVVGGLRASPASGASPSASASPAAGAVYTLPLARPLRVLRPFEPPPTPYAAGHRGVDLEGPAGAPVLATASGRVSFAGRVAGRGVVVIQHPDGIRTEYEPVAASVAAGQAVARGQPIGRLRGQHDRWPPGRCLHWGARRGEVYIDPLLLLRALGPVRLLPWPR